LTASSPAAAVLRLCFLNVDFLVTSGTMTDECLLSEAHVNFSQKPGFTTKDGWLDLQQGLLGTNFTRNICLFEAEVPFNFSTQCFLLCSIQFVKKRKKRKREKKNYVHSRLSTVEFHY